MLYVAYPGGEVRRVTNDVNDYIWVSVTRDGSKLLVVELPENDTKIWSVSRGDDSHAQQITFGESDGARGVRCAPDGRIVFADGACSIWSANPDGGDPRLLTGDDHTNSQLAIAPDGRSVLFQSWRSGNAAIWRMDMDGGNLEQLTSGPEDWSPSCSPDGDVLVFCSKRAGAPTVWKASTAGGEAVQLADRPAFNPVLSPDGTLIASLFTELGSRLESRGPARRGRTAVAYRRRCGAGACEPDPLEGATGAR